QQERGPGPLAEGDVRLLRGRRREGRPGDRQDGREGGGPDGPPRDAGRRRHHHLFDARPGREQDLPHAQRPPRPRRDRRGYQRITLSASHAQHGGLKERQKAKGKRVVSLRDELIRSPQGTSLLPFAFHFTPPFFSVTPSPLQPAARIGKQSGEVRRG